MKSIDLAIIGGGCAGLSMARDIAQLNEAGKNGREVTVFEPRTHYENDRTWCYWSHENNSQDPLVSRRWQAWQFSRDGENVVHHSLNSPYCFVSGSDFYADAQAKIYQSRTVELQLGVEVEAIEACAGGFKVRTTNGEHFARRIVDTRPPKLTQGAEIYQVFEGVEIETTQPLGDSEIASLMVNMQSEGDCFSFDYLLPLEPNRWLVEVTSFSPDPECGHYLSEKLQASLRRLIPDGNFQLLRQEKGMIPMGYRLNEPENDAGCVKAGTGGGAVRAASGYAYQRIQRWSQACAKHYLATGEVFGHPEDSWIQRKMDFLFLKVLRNEPELAPELFCRLARNLSADAMSRFMMDRASYVDLLSVIWALPKGPFLKHLFSQSDPLRNLPSTKGLT